ncbi:DUF4280 domain-containing protein [Spirulina sp. CCNP1310]|uniref:DUF4280 domain-containing protein n=1 Tax=Spirulina sp. CCNP1310 TaxID=3110249 RepID=UPI002B1ED1F5|nr:DUF4280 domain-containing protein [Spirulina sp. CCNP1310]MEA5421297.1 DUF4280 domain-containing protein [Spirulina sp. CCNP1310]
MPMLVTMGAMMQCIPFGAAPSSLMVIPKGTPVLASTFAASIMDFVPFVNILPFGVCTSMANPAVAAATAAAFGVLTPMPCTPVIVGPWTPGAVKPKIGVFPALSDTSICNCAFGGTIKITSPGQFKVTVT